MVTTKFEKFDRELTEDNALHISGLVPRDGPQYWSMIDRLSGAIGLAMAESGFGLLDGKMECIMGTKRQKMIGDVFGTPDEDRPCLAAELEEGDVIHYSKEYIRQLLIKVGYCQQLQDARKTGQPDPPIPQLRPEEIEEVSNRYIVFAQSYACKRLEIPG
jgi:phosphoribosylaminoimidazole-succinocarboxamide synthase